MCPQNNSLCLQFFRVADAAGPHARVCLLLYLFFLDEHLKEKLGRKGTPIKLGKTVRRLQELLPLSACSGVKTPQEGFYEGEIKKWSAPGPGPAFGVNAPSSSPGHRARPDFCLLFLFLWGIPPGGSDPQSPFSGYKRSLPK